jgi:hypothetical protein
VTEQSKPAQAWSRRIAFLLDGSIRYGEFADLLATVEPCWHDVVRAGIYGGGELWIGPAEGSVVGGASLRVRRTKTGFSMDLTRRQPSGGSVIAARARPSLPSAPQALAGMLRVMFEDREVTPAGAGSGTWEIVGSIRGWAAEDAAKAGLLESVNEALRGRCEIYDNGRVFGIAPVGDCEGDGAGIWISQVGDGWSFIHRSASPGGNGTTIVGEATASSQNAAETLNGLLEEMVSRMPAPEASAQDAYRQLLRDHVGPALRHHGYRGSGGRFDQAAAGRSIHFQKTRWSTRARVGYLLNIFVRYPGAAPGAGMYHAQYPGLTRSGRVWISLRPNADLEAHAASLLAEIHSVAFPAIEERLA